MWWEALECKTKIICKDCTCTVYGANLDKARKIWNTRKPMERIIEQLTESKEHYRRLWNKNQDDEDYGALSAYENAIDTVKEEGCDSND